MKIEVKIEGLDALRDRAKRMRENVNNMAPALLKAGVVPLKAAQERIDAGGPGWPENWTKTPILHQTGRLLSSLTVGASGNLLYTIGGGGSTSTVETGTNLRYAPWLQEGTGIYGPSGEPIRPKNGKALAFLAPEGMALPGGAVTAYKLGRKTRWLMLLRSVKGSPPRPFLFIDDQVAETVRGIFANYILGEEVET